jgi:hypothetical protein
MQYLHRSDIGIFSCTGGATAQDVLGANRVAYSGLIFENRRHQSAHGTAGGQHRGAGAWEALAFLGPSGGDDAGAGITAATAPAAISLCRPPGPSRGASPPRRRCGANQAVTKRANESWGSVSQSWGAGDRPGRFYKCPPAGYSGRRLPLVALVPQWRQDYPNKLPPKLAAVASEKGQRTKSLPR